MQTDIPKLTGVHYNHKGWIWASLELWLFSTFLCKRPGTGVSAVLKAGGTHEAQQRGSQAGGGVEAEEHRVQGKVPIKPQSPIHSPTQGILAIRR